MKRIFLLSGSNSGDCKANLASAAVSISETAGRIIQKSKIYKSEAWGYKSRNAFFNQCLELESDLSANEILEKLLEIETRMGRIRSSGGYADRLIDIDILFYGDDAIQSEKIIIPHPRLQLRKFALVTMNEIAGDFVHPVLKKKISDLLLECMDVSLVTEAG